MNLLWGRGGGWGVRGKDWVEQVMSYVVIFIDTNKKPRHNNNCEHMETLLGSN